MDNSVYIQKSENLTFLDFEGILIFKDSFTYLEEDVNFIANKLKNETHSYFHINPSENATRCIVNLSDIDSKKAIFYSENCSAIKESRKILLSPDNFYKLRIIYFSNITKPHTRLRFWISGYTSPKIQITDVYFVIRLNELKYECPSSCIRVGPNLEVKAPYRKFLSEEKKVKSYIFYGIYGNNNKEIWFAIMSKNKVGIFKNILLAIIAGLILTIMTVALKNRERYIEDLEKIRKRI